MHCSPRFKPLLAHGSPLLLSCVSMPLLTTCLTLILPRRSSKAYTGCRVRSSSLFRSSGLASSKDSEEYKAYAGSSAVHSKAYYPRRHRQNPTSVSHSARLTSTLLIYTSNQRRTYTTTRRRPMTSAINPRSCRLISSATSATKSHPR